MSTNRRQYSTNFKSKVALEAIRQNKTVAQIASEYELHPNQISRWKKQLLESLPEVFSKKRNNDAAKQQELTDELYRQIGQLKVELDWLKKSHKHWNRKQA